MAYTYKVKKGDNLNSIAQQYGFSNYKDAGINTVPSGNFNLIREGEEITIGNYNPNEVKGITTGSPVISSEDSAQSFKNDSNELQRMTEEQKIANDMNQKNKDKEETASYKVNKDGQVEVEGDDGLTGINAWETQKRKDTERETERQKKEYERMFRTNLSLIDSNARATTDRINNTYAKRIDEQNRINELNISRVKAYGLSNGGQYTPISFGDAITNRETEASNKILGLERERDNYIAEAKQAQEEGKQKLLEDKMNQIKELNRQMNESLAEIEKEAESQYQLLRDLRKEEEEKHQAEVKQMQERFALLAPSLIDEYDGKSEAEKDAYITKIASETGMDYATVYGLINKASFESRENNLKIAKDEATIRATNALTTSRNATTKKTNAETEELGNKEEMRKAVPTTFKDDTEFLEKRREYISKYGAEGQKYWDSLYKTNEDDYEYDTSGGDENGDDPLGIL